MAMTLAAKALLVCICPTVLLVSPTVRHSVKSHVNKARHSLAKAIDVPTAPVAALPVPCAPTGPSQASDAASTFSSLPLSLNDGVFNDDLAYPIRLPSVGFGTPGLPSGGEGPVFPAGTGGQGSVPGGGGGQPPISPPSPVGGVPEPMTWATMTVGFGMIGMVARRKSSLRSVV